MQTYNDWEWVVVNDGSTDGTVNEVKKISDPRVRLVTYQNNMGRGYARLRALAECQGDWMVVLDVDDLSFPERLEQIDAARNEGYDFFCSYAAVCTNQLDVKGVRGFFLPSHGLPKTFVYATMACRLDIAKKIGYDATVRTAEDTEIVWVLPNYAGMWCKSALYVYQEDREINLQKAIDSNSSQFMILRKLYWNKSLRLTKTDYVYQCCKYSIKLALLHLLKYKPGLHLKSVSIRNYGDVDPQYCLSDKQLSFLKEYKNKFVSREDDE